MPSPNSKQVGGDHYTKRKIQPWDVMQEYLSPEAFQGYLQGNVIKYVLRAKDKGGIQDLEKAQHYLEKLMEVLGIQTEPVSSWLGEKLNGHVLELLEGGLGVKCELCCSESSDSWWFTRNACEGKRS